MEYVSWFRRRAEEKESLREETREKAQGLSPLFYQGFRFAALYLIGSAIKGKGFPRHSDIDFVAIDLKEKLFFKTLAFLVKSIRFDVDLKP